MKPVPLLFSLNPNAIDYFKLKQTYFPQPFLYNAHKLPLTQNDYLDSKKWLVKNDNTNSETNVLNVQVGKGKTTFCYELVKHYQSRGYVVIWCSPFIKLIDKDYKKISNLTVTPSGSTTKGISGNLNIVFNYLELSKKGSAANFKSEVAANNSSVHIMTINCLLGNSGDEVFDQSFHKKNYLENLMDVCKNGGKKVVIFFDEIHESIHNFKSTLIPNLLKWKGLVEKVFISSATYTAAAIPVVKICSLLTDKNIRIFEADRIKNKQEAEINLHIGSFYKEEQKHFLNLIITEAKNCISNGTPINIITPTKALAENICQGLGIKKIQKKAHRITAYSKNHINLLVGGTEIEYSQGQNNIGTKFKTGIDITSANETLFIILPFNKDKKRRHIYSDGIPSIIQSIGRLRNGGKIHIIMSSPDLIIANSSSYPSYFSSAANAPLIGINKSYEIIIKEYNKKMNAVENEILELEQHLQISQTKPITKKTDFGIWYPNETEFLLKYSDDILMSNENPSFGSSFSPYVLWACIHDQFINATLDKVWLTSFVPLKVKISQSGAQANFQEIIADKITNSKIRLSTFRDAINNLDSILGKTTDTNKIEKDIKYIVGNNENSLSQLLARNAVFSQAALNSITQTVSGFNFPFTSTKKQDYLFASMMQAEMQPIENISSLVQAYKKLGVLVSDFHKVLKGKIVNSNLLPVGSHEELISDDLEIKFHAICDELKNEDRILKFKAFDIFQSAITKKQIASTLTGILYTRSTSPIMHSSKKYYEIELRREDKSMNGISLF